MKEVLKYPSKASIGIPFPFGGFFYRQKPAVGEQSDESALSKAKLIMQSDSLPYGH